MSEESRYPIIDGHNDALLNYAPAGEGKIDDFFKRRDGIQVDLPRAREGDFAGGFFAVFTPDDASMTMIEDFDPAKEYVLPSVGFNTAQRVALSMVANLYRIEAASNGQVRVVRTADELEACLRDGILAAILHFEGAEPIDPNLDMLEVYYQAGLRSMGFVWSRPTIFGEGVPFKFPFGPDTGSGLTAAGRELVRACNQMGIMIDLSHLNEKGFWDVAKLSTAPLVATHSNAHALCQLPRNLLDKQLDAIKESGGIVGVNMVVLLLREDGKNEPDTPLETIVRHVDYLVDRMGIDHVGFGSDFGVATMPAALSDVSKYPALIEALRQVGYDDAALRKLTHGNWLRVLRQTWK